jgi:hypothetical protein
MRCMQLCMTVDCSPVETPHCVSCCQHPKAGRTSQGYPHQPAAARLHARTKFKLLKKLVMSTVKDSKPGIKLQAYCKHNALGAIDTRMLTPQVGLPMTAEQQRPWRGMCAGAVFKNTSWALTGVNCSTRQGSYQDVCNNT